MDDKETKEMIYEEVKKSYLTQLKTDFVENPYNWQVKMTLVNMIIINLSGGKRRELFKYDDFCKETLRLSQESFDKANIENIIPPPHEFMLITFANGGDVKKTEEEILKTSADRLGEYIQRLDRIVTRKVLKDKFGKDFSETHVEFVDKFYNNKSSDYKEMYNFVKEKIHVNKENEQ